MTSPEEYEKLKTNLLSLNSENPIKTIMVSSAAAREGTTTVASNLAVTMAKKSTLKILLVDANLRHPNLNKFFALENKGGLSDLILGKIEISDVLKKTELPNLSVITSGACNLNHLEIFESERLKDIIKSLRNQFDHLIFDSVPINVYPDAQILASKLDGVVLVVRAGKTRRQVVQKAKEQLQRVNANIVGIILNRRKYVIPKLFYNRL